MTDEARRLAEATIAKDGRRFPWPKEWVVELVADAVSQAVKERPLSCGHRDDEWIALETTCREQAEEIARLKARTWDDAEKLAQAVKERNAR